MSLGKFAVDAIKAWNPLSPEAYERRDRNKAYRKARRKAKRGEPMTEQESQSLKQTEEVSMNAEVLQGKKSWIGLVTLLLGVGLKMAGVGECSAEALAAATCVPADTIVTMLVSMLDQILIAIGSVVTAWGVLMKQIREKRLKAQVEAAAKAKPAA